MVINRVVQSLGLLHCLTNQIKIFPIKDLVQIEFSFLSQKNIQQVKTWAFFCVQNPVIPELRDGCTKEFCVGQLLL